MSEEQFEDDDGVENEYYPEVKILRLSSGEDIIASLIEPDFIMEGESPHYLLFHPFVLNVTKHKGRVGINFKPWFFDAVVETDQCYQLYTTDIIVEAFPSDKVYESYMKICEKYMSAEDKTEEKKESVKSILDSMDRLEHSVKSNKNVKKFVDNMFKEIRKNPPNTH